MQRAHWLIGMALLAGLAGFTAPPAAEAASLQQVLMRGELRVGYSLAPPWTLRNDDGELEGFEVDVARRLAADMEVELRLTGYEHGELIRALEAGEIDLIAAGLTITPERALHVNFSRPYAVGGIGIATHVASTAEVAELEALDSRDYAIAVVEDSVAEDLAGRLFPRARIQPYPSEAAAGEALVAGEAAVYLEEEPVPSFLALEHPGTVDSPLGEPLLETRSAFAVGKGDPDFLAFLNAWIEAREADTWLPTTYRYWFRTLQWRD